MASILSTKGFQRLPEGLVFYTPASFGRSRLDLGSCSESEDDSLSDKIVVNSSEVGILVESRSLVPRESGAMIGFVQ